MRSMRGLLLAGSEGSLGDRAHAPLQAWQRRSRAGVAAAGVGEQDLRELDAQESLAGACAQKTTAAESISHLNTFSCRDGDAA